MKDYLRMMQPTNHKIILVLIMYKEKKNSSNKYLVVCRYKFEWDLLGEKD